MVSNPRGSVHHMSICWGRALCARFFAANILLSVLGRHVEFCLIASLIAHVHWKVRSLSESSWDYQKGFDNLFQHLHVTL